MLLSFKLALFLLKYEFRTLQKDQFVFDVDERTNWADYHTLPL